MSKLLNKTDVLLNTKVIGKIEVSHLVITGFIVFCGWLFFGENGSLDGMLRAWHLK